MASSRSNKSDEASKKKDVRFVKGDSTANKRAPQKTSRKAVSHTVIKPGSVSPKKKGPFKGEKTNFGWNDLVTSNDLKKSAHPEAETFLNTLSTARFAAVLLSILTLFTLYVGHVLTTQELMREVQAMRRENSTMNLRLNQLRAEEEELTGPAAFFDRARELGFEQRILKGTPITVE